MNKNKLISAQAAARLIQSGHTVASAGFVGIGFAEELALAIEKRFLTDGDLEDLTLVYAAGQGDGQQRGLNHLAHPGLIKRVIGGHWGLVPRLGALASSNQIEAYNLPQGVICQLYRDIAAGRPGLLTHVGLHTFVDPRYQGGRMNERTQENLVQLMPVGGKDYLFYQTFPLDIALLRGTTADELGNITMEREAMPLEALAIAQAVHNSGGKVIVQVERTTLKHQLTPAQVRIPGVLVDHVVVAQPDNHWQTFSEQYNPAYSGEIEAPNSIGVLQAGIRKLISRRSLMELESGAIINLGIGMPESVAAVAAEEELLDAVTMTIEPGGIGGIPAGGLSFGAVINAQAIVDQPAQFDFYDGGGLDQAFLGMAQVSPEGDVNVSRFGSKFAGAGGFINISQNAREIYFMGSFTGGEQEIEIHDQSISIRQSGPIRKFVDKVEHLTFNGQYALSRGQKVLYITERGVFRLTDKGIELFEIAPGVDLDTDILAHMTFKPLIAAKLRISDQRLYRNGPMHLKRHGSAGIHQMRRALAQAKVSFI